jgi:hypothetical protein
MPLSIFDNKAKKSKDNEVSVALKKPKTLWFDIKQQLIKNYKIISK